MHSIEFAYCYVFFMFLRKKVVRQFGECWLTICHRTKIGLHHRIVKVFKFAPTDM